MKLALSAVLLLSFSALGSDDFARVTLEGVLIQSGERLVLRADGMAYDLNFNSAVVRDEAITLVGRNVRSSGKLNLKAKPGSTSRLMFWPENIADADAQSVSSTRPENTISRNDPRTVPQGKLPERVSERPIRLQNDPGEMFDAPRNESILPKLDINW